MKVVHRNNKPADPDLTGREYAMGLERGAKWEDAVKEWKAILREHPLNAAAYDRLMILYRKLKDIKGELNIINKAIKTFESNYQKQKPTYNKRVTSLSKALLKSTGLATKEGKNSYEPAELHRWKRRLATIEARIRKNKR